MKLNWGTGILLSFIVFALSMAAIFIFAFNKEVDLVSDNYYEREIAYQEQIDKIERTARLSDEVKIEHTPGQLRISFPQSYQAVSGEILFYRPSDAKKDFSSKIMTSKSGEQVIDIGLLEKGLWKVKVLWSMDKQDYYYEKTIIL